MSVVAIGETRLTNSQLANKYGLDLNAGLRPGEKVVKVEPPLTEADFVLPPAVASQPRFSRLERLPMGLPLVTIEVMDDAAIARGEAATGGTLGDAMVFAQASDSGYFLPIVSSDAGSFEANLLAPGGGWTPAVPLTGLGLTLFNSSGGPSGPADIEAELWVGDPLGLVDTACGAAAPIAGTQCTWTNLADAASGPCALSGTFSVAPCVGLHELRCSFPGKVIVPGGCDHVWLVWQNTAGCRTGWRLSGSALGNTNDAPAQVGFSDGLNFVAGCQIFGALCTLTNAACANPASVNRECGTCCDNGGPTGGLPCDHTDGVLECAHATFCTDGAADLYTAYTYQQYGLYASYLASLFSPANVTIALTPTGNHPGIGNVDAGVTISGQRMSMAKGGRQVHFEVRLGDFDPADTGVQMKSYQVAFDNGAVYNASLGGTASPARVACLADNATCTAAFGTAAACDDPPGCPGGNCFCTALYIDTTRPGFAIPAGAVPLCAADLSQYRAGCATVASNVNDPVPYPAGGQYTGSLILDVTADAKGLIVAAFDPLQSSIINQDNLPISLVGFDPGLIEIVTGQCCDISAQPFVCLDDTGTKNECDARGGSFNGDKDCGDPCACEDNAGCADGNACTVDRCNLNDGTCSNTPVAVGSTQCCDATTVSGSAADINGTGAICNYEDNNACTDDSCSVGPGRGTCVNTPDATNACNDANPCTYGDICGGPGVTCQGADVNAVACTTSADCLATTGVAFDCIQGFCFCTIAPTITPVKVNPPAGNCYAEGAKVTVDVVVGAAASIINGGQFVLTYDPSCLNFNSIVPAGSVIPGNPYVTEIEELVDEAAGRVFYAVGVDPFGGVGVNGNAALARASFTKVGQCNSCVICFGGSNPQNDLLVDDDGQPVFVEPHCSKDINSANDVHVSVPDDVKSNVDCDFPTAIISWDPPSASSDCPDGVQLDCRGTYPNGAAIPAGTVQNGGEFPVGTSNMCCTASEGSCGGLAEDCWTVTVNEQTTLDVTVQLSPIISGEVERCITFQLYSDCVQAPLEFTKTLHFGGLFDHVGHFTDDIKIPDAGQWVCITARDQLHTLRACDFLECVAGDYIAVFKGDPFFGGNWLIGGNLDGWKKFNPNASHNVIDILDFGQFVANFGAQVDPNTPCGPDYDAQAHADINGDGTVNSLDYAFITRNFLASSKDCCCPGSGAAGSVARTSITVQELRELNMADLAVADLNKDGTVNSDDMSAFLGGEVPGKVPSRNRAGGLQTGRK